MDKLLSQSDISALDSELSGWQVSSDKLRRKFSFSDFPAAMAFMVRVSYAAASLGHHPNWSNVYSTVEVEIWSHDRGGVTGRCVELAKAMNRACVPSSEV